MTALKKTSISNLKMANKNVQTVSTRVGDSSKKHSVVELNLTPKVNVGSPVVSSSLKGVFGLISQFVSVGGDFV